MILVTGAAGNLGSIVIENLIKQVSANNIAGLYRSLDKAKFAEKGIDIRIGDYNDKQSLVNALQGIKKLLLVSSSGNNALVEHKNVIDAAKETGVKHIFYTSGALNKDVEQSLLGPLADSYVTTENYIIESGLSYTIFKNGLYFEAIPFFIGEQVLETGIYYPAGEGKVAFAQRTEMGEAIANVLVSTGHENKVYLTAAQPTYSFAEIAQLLSELSGKQVTYNSPDPLAYQTQLKKYGLSEDDISVSVLLASVIKNDEYNVTGSDMEQLLGRKPFDLKNYLKETFLP